MPDLPLRQALDYYDRQFPADFRKMLSELSSIKGDHLWMAGPSAYLFSLCDTHFGVDLQIRRKKDQEQLLPYALRHMASLSFILITHPHDDHMCIPFMQALRETSIRWYIPDGCKPSLIEASGLREENVIRVRPGDRFQEGALSIQAFYSPHVSPSEGTFPQCGYEITCPSGKRIIMPADVRDYTPGILPIKTGADLCFSHLWAGDDALHPDAYLPRLEDFCRFQADLGAKRYLLCHLYEIGRPPQYLWYDAHAAIAVDKISALSPQSRVDIPRVGQRIPLDFLS